MRTRGQRPPGPLSGLWFLLLGKRSRGLLESLGMSGSDRLFKRMSATDQRGTRGSRMHICSNPGKRRAFSL